VPVRTGREIRAKTTELEQFASRASRYHHSKQEIRDLVDGLQRAGDDDHFALRARVASQLKSLIGTLNVASVRERPLIMSRLKQLRRSENHGVENVIAERRAAHPDQARLRSGFETARFGSFSRRTVTRFDTRNGHRQ
jgi:hypothetical protein